MKSKLLFLLGYIPTRLFIKFLAYYSLNIESKYSNS